jgi:hypothetical protein
VLIFGGQAQDKAQERLDDLHSLVQLGQGGSRLCWSQEDGPAPAPGQPRPLGRSAHCLAVVGDVLYVLSGYTGSGSRWVQGSWRGGVTVAGLGAGRAAAAAAGAGGQGGACRAQCRWH